MTLLVLAHEILRCELVAALCQYLPKGTDLSGYTQWALNAIAHRLNPLARKCLQWATQNVTGKENQYWGIRSCS